VKNRTPRKLQRIAHHLANRRHKSIQRKLWAASAKAMKGGILTAAANLDKPARKG